MQKYTIVNILDMLDTIGEEMLIVLLSDFSCPINKEIEFFVKRNALEFAKRKLSITYFVIDNNSNIAAIFTLTHKAIEIKNKNMSNSVIRKLTRYASLDKSTNSFVVSAFLIAQFSKNFRFPENSINGNELMLLVYRTLSKIQREIGGGIIYLECEDRQKLLEFYQNEQNNFRIFGKRYSEIDYTKYIQLLRFL